MKRKSNICIFNGISKVRWIKFYQEKSTIFSVENCVDRNLNFGQIPLFWTGQEKSKLIPQKSPENSKITKNSNWVPSIMRQIAGRYRDNFCDPSSLVHFLTNKDRSNVISSFLGRKLRLTLVKWLGRSSSRTSSMVCSSIWSAAFHLVNAEMWPFWPERDDKLGFSHGLSGTTLQNKTKQSEIKPMVELKLTRRSEFCCKLIGCLLLWYFGWWVVC